jgi:HEAT repeat protein
VNTNQSDKSDTIKTYIADLANKTPEVREKARNYLIAAGDSAIPALIEGLKSSNSKTRWEAGKIIEDSELDWSKHTDRETINSLINILTSNDGFARLSSRNSLIKIGSKAVPGLIEALISKQVLTRWEAAKALSLIGDQTALQALVNAMDDKEFDVRWVAAEGLITLGNPAIQPLLHLIMTHPDSVRLREGVHHVLYALYARDLNEVIKPVIDALEDTEAPLQVPWAAEKALKSLNYHPTIKAD